MARPRVKRDSLGSPNVSLRHERVTPRLPAFMLPNPARVGSTAPEPGLCSARLMQMPSTMVSRHAVAFLWICSVVSACTEPTQPFSASSTFVLERIGDATLPASQWPSQPAYPTYLSDTLQVDLPSWESGQHVLWTHWLRNSAGSPSHSKDTYFARITADILTIDPCPVGAFCLAIYAPTSFQLRGDSLLELIPSGGSLLPRLYRRH